MHNHTLDIMLHQLWRAAATGDTATVRRIAVQNIDLDTPNPEGLSAFSLAMQHNHVDTARTIYALWLAGRSGYVPRELVGGHDIARADRIRR